MKKASLTLRKFDNLQQELLTTLNRNHLQPSQECAEAEKFVKELLEDVIPNGKVDRLAEFYWPDVIGHYGDDELFAFVEVYLADLKDRYGCPTKRELRKRFFPT